MSSDPTVFLFYGKDAGRLFTIHRGVTQACCNHSTHDPHVTHSLRVGGSTTGEGVTTVKTLPRVPAHRSGPGPTTLRAYVWPRPGGSCRCIEVGAFLYPFTYARAVIATPAAMLGGAEKGKERDCQGSTQARGMKSKGARWISPGNTLAGAAYIAPTRALSGRLAQHQQGCHP